MATRPARGTVDVEMEFEELEEDEVPASVYEPEELDEPDDPDELDEPEEPELIVPEV